MFKVTAILLKYKRPDEIEQIKKHLSQFPFIDEVLVWDNAMGINTISYGRYQCIKHAKNDVIYFQDDDCIIENIDELFKMFDDTKIINGLKESHIPMYQGKSTICGWGTFINRKWAKVLDKYLNTYGEDYTLYREADRLFTGLSEVGKLSVVSLVKDFPSATAEFALYQQPEHAQYKELALQRINDITFSTAQR